MTCIEKLRELHPDWDDDEVQYYVDNCCVVGIGLRGITTDCAECAWEDWPHEICEKCWKMEA